MDMAHNYRSAGKSRLTQKTQLMSTSKIKFRECDDHDVAYVSSIRSSCKKSNLHETFGPENHDSLLLDEASGIKINASIAESIDDFGEI